jgi:hypothetical protein
LHLATRRTGFKSWSGKDGLTALQAQRGAAPPVLSEIPEGTLRTTSESCAHLPRGRTKAAPEAPRAVAASHCRRWFDHFIALRNSDVGWHMSSFNSLYERMIQIILLPWRAAVLQRTERLLIGPALPTLHRHICGTNWLLIAPTVLGDARQSCRPDHTCGFMWP